MEKVNLNNIERFSGFSDTYDAYRPEAPEEICRILLDYLGRSPELVVDLGCGTGLSTTMWRTRAQRVIGIEPNDDMRRKAVEKLSALSTSNVSFMKGYSHETCLLDQSVDILTCSQAFHWMDPQATLCEANRILKDEGVFAVYDCDWPPCVDWICEKAFSELVLDVSTMLDERMPEQERVRIWNKGDHLKNIQGYGSFRFCREIVFHSKEYCDSKRFIGLALSQGCIQSGLRHFREEVEARLLSFTEVVESRFKGETRELLFGYRLRLGIK
ncbi:MAG: class I SAM-dependent methyltransferase [Clostridia bacterium]|nr:class I SAM-dependent methyltransferase [Clostridia bacterium]